MSEEAMFFTVLAACITSLIGLWQHNKTKIQIMEMREKRIKANQQFYENLIEAEELQNKLEHSLQETLNFQKECLSLREDLNKLLIANGFKEGIKR